MMPVVRINDGTFADLSVLRTWYGTKTPSETLDLVVREVMQQLGMKRDTDRDPLETNEGKSPLRFNTNPGLSFTKPLSASINRKAINKPNWTSILIATISQLKNNGLEREQLVRELSIPAKAENYQESGFRYYPKLGVSIQGQSAPDCWKEVSRLADKWHIQVSIEFLWKKNPKAQHPGKTGFLKAGPV